MGKKGNDQTEIQPCLIFIDKEGRWYHKGAEMIHREFIRLFYELMEMDEAGRYIIPWKGTRCYVDVEDTAFVVQRAQPAMSVETSGFELYLSDDTREDLDPETLWVGNENVLYCRVKGGAFPARFSRAAYYQLARYIEEDDEQYYLPSNGKTYTILEKDR